MSNKDLTWDNFINPNFKAINSVRNIDIEWDIYQKNFNSILAQANQSKELTNILCPKCNNHIWRRNDIVYTSYPPKYEYFCDCGWKKIGY